MLPREHRLSDSEGFRAAARGRRSAGRALVVHLREATDTGPTGPRVGFVVGRAVGGAVVRNRVRRRLRHLVATRLAALPAGARVSVRALPRAATTTYAELGADLDRCLLKMGIAAEERLIAATSGPRVDETMGA